MIGQVPKSLNGLVGERRVGSTAVGNNLPVAGGRLSSIASSRSIPAQVSLSHLLEVLRGIGDGKIGVTCQRLHGGAGLLSLTSIRETHGWAKAESAWHASGCLAGTAGQGMALLYPNLSAVADISHPNWRSSAIGIYRFWGAHDP